MSRVKVRIDDRVRLGVSGLVQVGLGPGSRLGVDQGPGWAWTRVQIRVQIRVQTRVQIKG